VPGGPGLPGLPGLEGSPGAPGSPGMEPISSLQTENVYFSSTNRYYCYSSCLQHAYYSYAFVTNCAITLLSYTGKS